MIMPKSSTSTKKVSSGTVHTLPQDLKQSLLKSKKALETWEDITPLARNEFICWVTDGKKEETRMKRLPWAIDLLSQGKRRPCCWPGCPHRQGM